MASVKFDKYIRLIKKLPAEIDVSAVDESDFAAIEQVNANRLLVSKTLTANRNQIVNAFLKKEVPHDLEKLEAILDKYRSAKKVISDAEWVEDRAKMVDILTVVRDHKNRWYSSNAFIITLVTGIIGVILAFLLKDLHIFGPGSEPSVPTIDNRGTDIGIVNQFSGNIKIGNM